MQAVSARVFLSITLLGGCALGCRTTKGPSYPPDPLFAIKKPQMAKAADTSAPVVAHAAPDVPSVPNVILAARPPQGEYRVGYPPGASP